MLVVRTAGNPLGLSAPIRNAVLQLDRDQPVSQISTMNEIVETSEGQLRLMMRLRGVFAAVALGLALLGLYGVISYAVVRRTREIGIRRALGAQSSDLIYLLLRRAFILVGSGVVLGLGAAVLVTRLLQDFLFQVGPTDPPTFVATAATFALIAIGASLIPALRATEIEPLLFEPNRDLPECASLPCFKCVLPFIKAARPMPPHRHHPRLRAHPPPSCTAPWEH
jgi:putative ABC transport system permease protein